MLDRPAPRSSKGQRLIELESLGLCELRRVYLWWTFAFCMTTVLVLNYSFLIWPMLDDVPKAVAAEMQLEVSRQARKQGLDRAEALELYLERITAVAEPPSTGLIISSVLLACVLCSVLALVYLQIIELDSGSKTGARRYRSRRGRSGVSPGGEAGS